jgi:hypothetical protein
VTHKFGDDLFFALAGVAGEDITLASMKADPGAVMLAVGKQPVEIGRERLQRDWTWLSSRRRELAAGLSEGQAGTLV